MDKTVVKALRVLETLARSPAPCALGEVAASCALTKSNAHRLLKTLQACHYVRQLPEARTYENTLRLWELGTHLLKRYDIRSVAGPFLTELHGRTREAVHLSILDEGEVIYLDKIDGVHAVGAYIRVGERAPAYCTSTGRAMLAFMSDEAISAACCHIERHTEKTVASEEEVRHRLAEIRRTGVSLTFGEWREGVVGVAAPIRTEIGAVVAAIGVAGPPDRMNDGNLAGYADAVRETAQDISDALGPGGMTSDRPESP